MLIALSHCFAARDSLTTRRTRPRLGRILRQVRIVRFFLLRRVLRLTGYFVLHEQRKIFALRWWSHNRRRHVVISPRAGFLG